MKHLVIGLGEVGTAIKTVLKSNPDFVVHGLDLNSSEADGKYDVIHICIPHNNERFVPIVQKYIDDYGIKNCLVIVHSSVPVGTCSELKAVHSPITGVHPHLEESVRKFVKYFGGKDAELASSIFQSVGVITRTTPKAETTELGKLFATTIYGMNIIAQKWLFKECEKLGADFDIAYTDMSNTYNTGYEVMGMPQFKRYVLRHMEGKIGGHCILENCLLLDGELANFVLEQNEKL